MAKTATTVRFTAKLSRPGGADESAPWVFLNLPQDASDQLPARSMVSVEGTVNDKPFQTTLLPDGNGGHWMKLEPKVQDLLGVVVGEELEFEFAPAAVEPEPEVPEDVLEALESAGPVAQTTWADITAMARRDWIFWIVSGKKAETRLKRIGVAMSKLSAGNRRPCCFDRSGMYDKSLSCPIADEREG